MSNRAPSTTIESHEATRSERPVDPTGPVTLPSAIELIRAAALTDRAVGPVGLEIEGHVIRRGAPRAAPDFALLKRIETELRHLPAGGLVTLEPGGQLEISSAVQPDGMTAIHAMRSDVATMRRRLAADGLGWVLLGADPLRPPRRVNPAARYAGMESWFAADERRRQHGATMMCSTAALQINLEAGHRFEWADRVTRAQQLGPLLTALTGSSAFLCGADSGWQSARQRAWSGLDPLTSSALPTTGDPVQEWVDRALAAPVVLLRRQDGELRAADRHRSLRQWLTEPDDWPPPTESDIRRHLTTIFPPVRLRGWLELRCLDSLPDAWWPAVVAATVAWMDEPSLREVVDRELAGVADRWDQAARLGLADESLAGAAATLLGHAVDVVPVELRDGVRQLHQLARQGRTPGSLITQDLRTRGPQHVMEELADD